MTNNYYNVQETVIAQARVRSRIRNDEFNAIEDAFDMLPSVNTSLTTGTATFAGDSTGAANAYAVTMPDTRTANADGDHISFIANHTSTGAATLNVDSIGAVTLVDAAGDAIVANGIELGLVYECRYDASNTRFQMISPLATADEHNAGLTVSGGDIVIGDAGDGIDFSVNTGTAATGAATTNEVLDHFERGTWTPVLWDGSLSSGEGQTYTLQTGTFQRIGDVVWVFCNLTVNSLGTLTSGDPVYIGGLPYDPGAATSGTASVGFASSLVLGAAGESVAAVFNGSQNAIQLYVWDAASGPTAMTIAEFSSGGRITLSGSYTV